MNILQVGNIDTIGSRFNGTDLSVKLRKKGFPTKLYVFQKESNNKCTLGIANGITKLLNAIKTVKEQYDEEIYLQRLINLYKKVSS